MMPRTDQPGIWCHVQGHDIYQNIWLPFAPHKGDILWLNSLTSGAAPESEVLVSKVEWAYNHVDRIVELWVTVRRMPERKAA